MPERAMIDQYREICKRVRIDILEMAYRSKTGHIGPSYSIVELLVALYFEVMRIDPENPADPLRDHFILSKGHAAPALYAVLAHRNFFPREILSQYRTDGGKLSGHVCKGSVPGIEVSSGSLGHGLSIAAGIAHAKKKQGIPSRVYVLLGDGECNEGAIWEAAMYASHRGLDNLAAIIDCNKFQGFGATHEVTSLFPLLEKWVAFGWGVVEIDGHNLEEIIQTYQRIPLQERKPTVILAHTIAGKGMKHIENTLRSHYYSPDEAVYQEALRHLYAQ